MKRKSIGNRHSMVVQPAFIIGTYDENQAANFAPITWVSVTWCNDHYRLVISMNGTKKTKQNAAVTNALTANPVSTGMLKLMDYLGTASGGSGPKNKIAYSYTKSDTVNAPMLNDSKWVYECEVSHVVEMGDTHTYFCEIKNVQVDETAPIADGCYDLLALDPVVYSGNYYTVGNHLGKIADFAGSLGNC